MLANLNTGEVIKTLSPYLPQDVRLLLAVDVELKTERLLLQAVKCLKTFETAGGHWIAGNVYQAWFFSHGNDYYIVFPGQEDLHIVNNQFWQPLEEAQRLEEIEITTQKHALRPETETYRLIINSENMLQLVPAWWLNVKKIIGCYFLNAKSVSYCLQLIESQGKQLLSWRLISTFPMSQIQWFVIEQGKFIDVTEVCPLHRFASEQEGKYRNFRFMVANGILKFVF